MADSFQILGYPHATVIAEKLSTAVSLGDLNTRDRDYGDLCRLLNLNDLDGQELTTALTATAHTAASSGHAMAIPKVPAAPGSHPNASCWVRTPTGRLHSSKPSVSTQKCRPMRSGSGQAGSSIAGTDPRP
jgi:hypothetical protein